MWVKSYSKIYQNVKKEDVWRVWTDVNNWPKWDKELEYCKMEAPFIHGSQFILKPKGGPKVKIILSEVIPNVTFTDYCRFPGATMHDAHYLEETPEGLKITYTVTVTGILSFLWVKLVAQNVVNSLPDQTDQLVKLARMSNEQICI